MCVQSHAGRGVRDKLALLDTFILLLVAEHRSNWAGVDSRILSIVRVGLVGRLSMIHSPPLATIRWMSLTTFERRLAPSTCYIR